MNEFPVFHYQYADSCCVPVAILNSIHAVFDPIRLPPTVVRTVWRHGLDHSQARMTSDEAIDRIANEIDRLGSSMPSRGTRFKCSAEYLMGEHVTLDDRGPIAGALNRGGSAMILVCKPRSLMHALALLAIKDGYAFCFDSILRTHYRPSNGLTFLRGPGFCKGPNLKIAIEHLESDDPTQMYALGPIEDRQAVIFEP